MRRLEKARGHRRREVGPVPTKLGIEDPGMNVGSRRLLGIPSDQAYGPTGQGSIGPDEALWFVVAMVATQ